MKEEGMYERLVQQIPVESVISPEVQARAVADAILAYGGTTKGEQSDAHSDSVARASSALPD